MSFSSVWRTVVWRIYLMRFMILFSASFIPASAAELYINGPYEPSQQLIINIVMGVFLMFHHIGTAITWRWLYGFMDIALVSVEFIMITLFVTLFEPVTFFGGRTLERNYASSLKILVTSNSVALFFGLFVSWTLRIVDSILSKGRSLKEPYNIFMNCELPRAGSPTLRDILLWKEIWRPTFEGEFITTRVLRGIAAMSLLVAVLVFSFFALIVDPIQQSNAVSVKQYAIDPNDYTYFSRNPTEPVWSIVAYGRNTNITSDAFKGALNISSLWSNSQGLNSCTPLPVFSATYYPTITIYCPSPDSRDAYSDDTLGISYSEDTPEIQITVNFTSLAVGQAQLSPLASARIRTVAVFIQVGLTNNTGDVTANTVPTPLLPGNNLIGMVRRHVRRQMVDPYSARFGLSTALKSFVVADIGPIIPDPSPFAIGSDIATLRLFVEESERDLIIKEDYMDNTVLAGIAQVGGFWASLNSITAVLFWGGVLFILFGSKPLSVYGGLSAHLQKRTLMEGIKKHYPALAEENAVPQSQRGLLALIRDTILDIDPIPSSKSRLPSVQPADFDIEMESASLIIKNAEGGMKGNEPDNDDIRVKDK